MKKMLWAAALLCARLAAAQGPAELQWSSGEVLSVEPTRGQVVLKHGPINTRTVVMEAMTMPFKTLNATALKSLHPGDHVRFVVHLLEGEPVITRIEAMK